MLGDLGASYEAPEDRFAEIPPFASEGERVLEGRYEMRFSGLTTMDLGETIQVKSRFLMMPSLQIGDENGKHQIHPNRIDTVKSMHVPQEH